VLIQSHEQLRRHRASALCNTRLGDDEPNLQRKFGVKRPHWSLPTENNPKERTVNASSVITSTKLQVVQALHFLPSGYKAFVATIKAVGSPERCVFGDGHFGAKYCLRLRFGFFRNFGYLRNYMAETPS
jgi:hypothetical protein